MRKTLRSKCSNRMVGFALIPALFVALMVGACSTDTPAPSTGVVTITVENSGGDGGDGSGDTLDPQLPWLTRYELRFTGAGKTASRTLEQSMVAGYQTELEEGDWELEVTGYTAGGVAAEQGHAAFSLNLSAAAPEVTVALAAVNGNGIFTYTISWPPDVADVTAQLRFERDGADALIISDIANGQPASTAALSTGLYDVVASLHRGGEVIKARYVLANIAAGCETLFTCALTPDAGGVRYLAGALAAIGGRPLLDAGSPLYVNVYADKQCATALGTATWSSNGAEWFISVPSEHPQVYFTLSGTVGGTPYTVPAGELLSIPQAGRDGIPLNFRFIWYVAAGASGTGSYGQPFASVQQALTAINTVKNALGTWPVGEPASIVRVSGHVSDGALLISGAPVILEGYDQTGVIDLASGTSLTIQQASASVTLRNNLTLNGGGVSVEAGAFILDGGTLSGATSTGDGGGVRVASGATFTMNAGSISENNALTSGGGVYTTTGGIFNSLSGSLSNNTPNNQAMGN
ncbi:MAG: hypothetical protein LBS86_08175 [Treponema sp.]|jgi:hypothetical protein|nr:hypothetical protein [Treponema sp.]